MKKKEKRMLLWGALGIGALWFFTRPKSTPPPPGTRVVRRATEASTLSQKTQSVARVGLPYTFNAEI